MVWIRKFLHFWGENSRHLLLLILGSMQNLKSPYRPCKTLAVMLRVLLMSINDCEYKQANMTITVYEMGSGKHGRVQWLVPHNSTAGDGNHHWHGKYKSTAMWPWASAILWVGLALGQGDKAAFGEVDILRQLQVLKETTTPVLFTVDHHFTYDSKLHQLQFVNTRQHLSVLLDERQ